MSQCSVITNMDFYRLPLFFKWDASPKSIPQMETSGGLSSLRITRLVTTRRWQVRFQLLSFPSSHSPQTHMYMYTYLCMSVWSGSGRLSSANTCPPVSCIPANANVSSGATDNAKGPTWHWGMRLQSVVELSSHVMVTVTVIQKSRVDHTVVKKKKKNSQKQATILKQFRLGVSLCTVHVNSIGWEACMEAITCYHKKYQCVFCTTFKSAELKFN